MHSAVVSSTEQQNTNSREVPTLKHDLLQFAESMIITDLSEKYSYDWM